MIERLRSGPVHARGYFDRLRLDSGGSLEVAGWMLIPDHALSHFAIEADGQVVHRGALHSREDIAGLYPWMGHAHSSGFSARVEGIRPERVVVLGLAQRRLLARMESVFDPDLDRRFPDPPEDLMFRVAGSRNAPAFRSEGHKLAGEFLAAVRRYGLGGEGRRALDWGCGCGRIIGHLRQDAPELELHGCDVDAEAIRWSQAQLQDIPFQCIAPVPPTPYPAGSFDLVYGCSVMTHLSREMQRAWLEELRRITTPGALVLLSVHGPSAAYFLLPQDRRAASTRSAFLRYRLMQRSIVERASFGGRRDFYDGIRDPALDGVLPEGYYRATFQSRRYTRSAYAEGFDVLAYEVRGIGNHQDLVVLRRTSRGA